MITEELMYLQGNLVALKGERNTFGNYNYRTAEGILAAVKPLLVQAKCFITLSDEMVEFANGTRVYIKATATITNGSGESISATALAREALVQKGMNDAQITGSASSYARKYALNGLLAIDDSKSDPDVTNRHGKERN